MAINYFQQSPSLAQRATVIAEILVYPIKSLGGVSLNTTQAPPRGLALDRRWMVVNAQGARQSQREHPQMALAQIALEDAALQVTAPGMQPLSVPLKSQYSNRKSVTVGRTTLSAPLVSDVCDAWFTNLLDEPAHLVHMDDATYRVVNPQFALNNDTVSFADGYPYMLVSEASLADLNARLPEILPMNRFRPNFVIRGVDAFAEDSWKELQIGAARFSIVKPCDRCVLTTIDQTLGERRGPEPLKTLSQYRRVEQDVLFGQYMLLTSAAATVSVGDTVKFDG